MTRFILGIGLLGVFGLGVGASAYGGTITYGTYVGTDTTYASVRETPGGDADPNVSLFGAPTLAGNSLAFFPTNFMSTSSGTTTSQTIDSLLQYTINANEGHYIDTLTIRERGDYNVTNSAQAGVGAHVFWVLMDGQGNQTYIGLDDAADLTFTPSGTFAHTGAGIINGSWAGSVTLDFQAMYPGFHATSIQLSIDNTLSTSLTGVAGDGSSAFIRKKTVNDVPAMSIAVNDPAPVVPLPAALWAGLSMLGGLGAAVGLRRKLSR